MTGGFGADYTFEATGITKVMGQAVESARMGWGLCTVAGVAGKGIGVAFIETICFGCFYFRPANQAALLFAQGVAGAFDRSKQNQETTHDRVENDICRHGACSDFLDAW